ncbi:MAG: NifU N-terminal domain-containing protein [Bacteroidota bacterium]
MPTFRTQSTPNPNSIKVTTDAGPFISEGMESFNTKLEADQHPLGAAVFTVPGVASVFIMPDFLTVTRDPTASWDLLLPALQETLATHFEAR